MNNLIIFLVKGISGGTATLSYRIGIEYIKHGYEVCYLFDINNDSKNENLMKKEGFILIQSREINWKKEINQICGNYQNVVAITYTLHNYVLLDSVKLRVENFNKYLYVVSTASIVKGVSNDKLDSNSNILCKFSNTINRNYINYLFNNNHLLFMDELSLEIARTHLKLDFINAEEKTYLLPYDVKHTPKYVFKKRNIIVTMARISFPFKGYIIGLVDIFKNLADKYNAELWIIGDGESRSVLEKKIRSLPENISSRIKLFNSISYDKIGDILVDAKVFVGMGTGVLDASAYGLPCIAVAEYSYECLSKGRFDEYPRFVGFGKKDTNTHIIQDDIEYIFQMDSINYIDLCKKNYKALLDNYSMDEFYQRLDQNKNITIRKCRINKIGPDINRCITKVRDLIN